MASDEKAKIPEEQPLKENNEAKCEDENRSLLQRLRYLKSIITVEPIMAGIVIPSMLSRMAVQNLNLEKTCRFKLDLGDDICTELISKEGNLNLTNTTYEGDIQKVISAIEAWKSVIQTAIPTLLVIFMGAWSDRTGNRKLPILLPILGELLVSLTNIMSTVFFKEISVEVTMFLEAIFPALTGGWVTIYLGVFSYISDITDESSRTFRVGLVNLCLTAGIPIGTALSGILLKTWGYYCVFSMSAFIYLLTLTYGFIYLKRHTKHQNENHKEERLKCKDIFLMVKETAAVAYRKREGNTRMKIILTLLVVAIIYGPNHGERIMFYMYMRYRLNWDALKFSIYSTYSILTHSVGALFSITVFSKQLGFHDSLLCLISVVSKLAGSIFIIFVRTDFHMVLVPLIEILNATTFTSLRSMASKLVPNEEMGKMNSLFSLVETLAALMFDPTYSTLYYNTIGVFIGAVFVFSCFMTLPPISILVWFFTQHRLDVRQRRREEKEEYMRNGDCTANMELVETPEVVLEA